MPWVTNEVKQSGWNAGARSVAEMTGDGEFTFHVGQAVGVICGLNNSDETAGYREIKHGFFIASGVAKVIEFGEVLAGSVSVTRNTEFKISRIGAVVSYYINGNLWRISTIPSIGTVFLDSSLYADRDSIVDIEFNEINELRINDDIQLPSLAAFGSDVDFLSRITLPAIKVTTSVSGNATEYIRLPAVTARGSDSDFGCLKLPGLVTVIDDIVPEVNYGSCRLPVFNISAVVSETYTASVDLPAVISFGTDTDGIGFISLPAIKIQSSIYIDNTLFITLPYFTGYGNYNDTILTIPSPILTATATTHTSGVSLTVPSPVLTAYSGVYTALEPPAPILTATATSPGFAVVTLELPEPILVANALTGEVATVTLLLPEPVLSAYSGAFASLEMPEPVLSSTGRIFGFATVSLTIPSPELTASGEIYGLASVALEIPSPVLYAGMGNWVALEIPSPILVVVANPALTTAETTYAINLNTGAVTQLLLGGFDKLVTAHGRLYGLKNGALTRLDGDVDGTTTTIPATIRFAPQTFGTNVVKRISDVYWSTREADGITMELVADERTVWRYQTPTDTAPAFGTHKIKTGRGVTFHTAGLTLRNRDGGMLDVGGVELLVSALSRKPK